MRYAFGVILYLVVYLEIAKFSSKKTAFVPRTIDHLASELVWPRIRQSLVKSDSCSVSAVSNAMDIGCTPRIKCVNRGRFYVFDPRISSYEYEKTSLSRGKNIVARQFDGSGKVV